jgi:hypothetical protein
MKPDQTAQHLEQYLADAGKAYPGAWKAVEGFREDRGKGLPAWPDWCHLPMAGAIAIVSKGASIAQARAQFQELTTRKIGPAALMALASWRVTKGIYRFDPELFQAVWETPLEGNLPHELLYRLPEWCVYLETPVRDFLGRELRGFFAHLEHDANNKSSELRMVLDVRDHHGQDVLEPVVMILTGHHTLQQALEAVRESGTAQAARIGMKLPEVSKEQHAAYRKAVEPLVSLVLYLCSIGSDVRDGAGTGRTPARPKPTKTKRGERLFQAEKQTTWEVGYRIGAALRRAMDEMRSEHPEKSIESRTRPSPRPHIRRAHWHSYWTGPRKDRKKQEIVTRWLPPIPVKVGLEGEELVPTIRPVKGPSGQPPSG